MDTIVTIALGIIAAYLGVGLLFALPFVFIGVAKIDAPTAAAGFWFKLILIPGSTVFWPLLLKRWLRGEPPPAEHSAHRASAQSPPHP